MPSPLAFLTADYAQALLNLLPRGRIWRRDPDSILVKTLTALAPTYERSTASALQLLVDTLPTTTSNLLPEWEASLGLPDACSPADQTLGQRKAAVAAKWAARGGQSQAYYIKLAASLGYAVTITQFAPSRFGRPFGSPFGGIPWAFAWQINAPTYSVQPFEFGGGSFGDPFATFGGTYLQCRIKALSPAHTTPFFNYSGLSAHWDGFQWDDGSVWS